MCPFLVEDSQILLKVDFRLKFLQSMCATHKNMHNIDDIKNTPFATFFILYSPKYKNKTTLQH